MSHSRRHFLQWAAAAGALAGVPRRAWPQSYPARPLHLVVGFPAGSAPDIVARIIGQRLTERLGQQFIVDDRPGAASSTAAEFVVRASPDGYTLLWASAGNATNAALYEQLSYNFIRDILPVAGIIRAPLIMVVHPSVPARTVGEFIAYAKANPGKLNMASGGVGALTHLGGELFKMMTGIDMLHVPYRGNFRPDLLAGQVQVAFDPIPSSIEFVRAGKLVALAVTSTKRLDTLPDIPTVSETVPGYEAGAWYGLGAPRGTPAEITGRLASEFDAALADPAMKLRLADVAAVPDPMSAAAFATFIAEETAKWTKVVRFANIKPE